MEHRPSLRCVRSVDDLARWIFLSPTPFWRGCCFASWRARHCIVGWYSASHRLHGVQPPVLQPRYCFRRYWRSHRLRFPSFATEAVRHSGVPFPSPRTDAVAYHRRITCEPHLPFRPVLRCCVVLPVVSPSGNSSFLWRNSQITERLNLRDVTAPYIAC